MDEEPAVNIAGGDAAGGEPLAVEHGEPATRAEAVVDRLGDLYWTTTYGGQDATECLVRTVLSQNTSDQASQPAHEELLARWGPAAELAENLAAADPDAVAEAIRPAGLHNRKSATIVALARRICEEHGGTGGFDTFVRESDPEEVRQALLDMDGVGPKTADCVLLFAAGRDGVFPVDTHVHRLYRRLGVAPPDADHEAVREVLERDVPAGKCGFGHTVSIQFGREYCTAGSPACLEDPGACPLAEVCDRVGVYPDADEVVDPADAR